jgi:hypothetical protein
MGRKREESRKKQKKRGSPCVSSSNSGRQKFKIEIKATTANLVWE